MNTSLSAWRAALLGLALSLLSACASGGATPDAKLLDQTLDAYASAIRWNGLDATSRYLDPEQVAAHPPSEFDLERLRQLEVVNYRVLSRTPADASHIEQLVEIELSNKHSQTVRTVRVAQRWQFDPARKRWWLASGLPDVSQK